MEDRDLIMNTEHRRFEMEVEGQMVLIDYKLKENTIALLHTQVPPELEGKGFGKAIVEKTLNYIKTKDYKLAPLCSFVAAYIKRHPEWNTLLAAGSDK